MKLKFVLFFLILCSIFIFSDEKAPNYQTVEANKMSFSWRINNNMLDIIMKAPTTGWLSVGIDPSNKMKDANFILGGVIDGKAVFQDNYGTGNLTHEPDVSLGGTDDIKNKSAKESSDSTEISFSIPLDSGDKYDKKITKGKHNIILAYSSKDDFTKKHKKKAKFEITIN